MSGEAAAIGSAFLWALSSAMLRGLTAEVPSLALNALRSLVGMAAYAVIVTGSGKLPGFGQFGAENLLFLTVNVGVGIVLGDTAYYSSMRQIGLSRAMTIASTYPLLTAILAGLFLGESFGPATWAGFVLCVGGVILVARSGLQPAQSGGGRALARGVWLAVAASALWAVGTVSLRRGSEGMDPFLVNFLRMSGVALVAGLWARARGEFGGIRRLAPSRVALLVAGALIGSVIGTMLYLTAVQTAGASKAAVLASIAPLFSVPMSMLAGEPVNRRLVVGMAAAVAGIVIVLR
ncbi:MAG: DMT family transporter [Anaerolineae bacterium]